MKKHLTDSMKARLYDFTYTPFMSAYIFSWLFWNSKLILIFFDTKLTVNEKVNLLSWNEINYFYPLYFSLFFVFVYPIFSATFYAATLGYKALMNNIQQKIQDRTPLPQEKANKIIKENTELTNEIYELNLKLTELKSDYKEKEKKLNEEIEEKAKKIEDESTTYIQEIVNDKTLEIQKQMNEASRKISIFENEDEKNRKLIFNLEEEKKKNEVLYNELEKRFKQIEERLKSAHEVIDRNDSISKTKISELNDEIARLLNLNSKQVSKFKKEKKELEENNEKELKKYQDLSAKRYGELKEYKIKEEKELEFKNKKYEKYLEVYTNDEMKYFETIYTHNIKDRIQYSDYITSVTTKSKLERITIEHISEVLKEKRLITINNVNDVFYSKELKKLIYEIFADNKSEEIYSPKIEDV